MREYNQRCAFLPSSSQLLCAPALSSVLQLPSFEARAAGEQNMIFCFAHFIFPSQSSITAMDEEDGQDYPEFLLPLWSHETLLVLLPCSLSLQPRPNLTTRIMRLAATISIFLKPRPSWHPSPFVFPRPPCLPEDDYNDCSDKLQRS